MCGCSGYEYPSETDMEYMVSSLGFDKNGEKVSAFAEIIVVNSGDGEKSPEVKLFEGVGENVRSALYSLNKGLAKPLMVKHCGLLVIGDGIDADTLNDIFVFSFENKEITQAIKVVSTENAGELLSLKANSNIALGYELTTALKQNSRHTGIVYKNRLYEIAASLEKKSPYYALPVFSVSNDKYSIDGVKIFFDTNAVLTTDEKGAILHAIMSNNFKNGEIKLGSECFNVKLCSVKYDFSYKKNLLKTDVVITVDTQNNDNLLMLKNAIHKQTVLKTDIYGILDRIYAEKPELFSKIKDNYGSLFGLGEINFTVRGRGDE